MIQFFQRCHSSIFHRLLSILLCFTLLSSVSMTNGYAQSLFPDALHLPSPGTMVYPQKAFTPPLVRGMTVDPANALQFSFIVDEGDAHLTGEAFAKESMKLVKYFLAALTVPEKDMWVNLSPYEKDRIIPAGFGDTEMGRDLLAQDYLLKQLAASLTYPEDKLGREFWERVHALAREKLDMEEVAVNTFNKIWIVPRRAVIYEQGNSAYLAESELDVMIEEDLTALQQGFGQDEFKDHSPDDTEARILSNRLIREILIPEIRKEVNRGQTFAGLRQIYNAMILASWYKTTFQKSLLGHIYVDQNKTIGVDTDDKEINQKIYAKYQEAFQTGVFNYIREEYDAVTRDMIPHKYFSGGFSTRNDEGKDLAMLTQRFPVDPQRVRELFHESIGRLKRVVVNLADIGSNVAQAAGQKMGKAYGASRLAYYSTLTMLFFGINTYGSRVFAGEYQRHGDMLTVKILKGDTLFRFARDIWGGFNALQWKQFQNDILQANFKIMDPDFIFQGDSLRIPAQYVTPEALSRLMMNGLLPHVDAVAPVAQVISDQVITSSTASAEVQPLADIAHVAPQANEAIQAVREVIPPPVNLDSVISPQAQPYDLYQQITDFIQNNFDGHSLLLWSAVAVVAGYIGYKVLQKSRKQSVRQAEAASAWRMVNDYISDFKQQASFVTAGNISREDMLEMQASLQSRRELALEAARRTLMSPAEMELLITEISNAADQFEQALKNKFSDSPVEESVEAVPSEPGSELGSDPGIVSSLEPETSNMKDPLLDTGEDPGEEDLRISEETTGPESVQENKLSVWAFTEAKKMITGLLRKRLDIIAALEAPEFVLPPAIPEEIRDIFAQLHDAPSEEKVGEIMELAQTFADDILVDDPDAIRLVKWTIDQEAARRTRYLEAVKEKAVLKTSFVYRFPEWSEYLIEATDKRTFLKRLEEFTFKLEAASQQGEIDKKESDALREALTATFKPVWQVMRKKDFVSYYPDQALILKDSTNLKLFDEQFKAASETIISAVDQGILRTNEGQLLLASLKTQFLPVRAELLESLVMQRYARQLAALMSSKNTEIFNSNWKDFETTISLDLFRNNISDARRLQWVELIKRIKNRYQPIRAVLAAREAPPGIKEVLAGETGDSAQSLEEILLTMPGILEQLLDKPDNSSVKEIAKLALAILLKMGKSLSPELINFREQLEAELRIQETSGSTDNGQITADSVGGIFLDRNLLDLQIIRDKDGIALPLHNQPIDSISIQGFLPVIVGIQPIENLLLLDL